MGLVADPGLCARVAEGLAGELPGVLAEQVSSEVTWQVGLAVDAIPLDSEGDLLMVEYAREKTRQEGWDLLIYLTELPQRAGNRPVLAEFSTEGCAGQVCLPAVGWFRIRPHVRETIVYLVAEVTGRRLAGRRRNRPEWPRLLRRRLAEHVSPVRPLLVPDDGIDGRLTLTGTRGRLRLLFGMVRNNRPWRLVPSLGRAAAAAAGLAGFVIFYSTVWRLAVALALPRLLAINLFAVLAMTAWLIMHNRLWERPLAGRAGEWAFIYNAATVLTVFLGVAFMYGALFVFSSAAAAAIIPPGYLQALLHRPVGWGTYATLVWLATSIGTIAGALGSSFETEDAIRRATYSVREQERRARQREREQREAEQRETEQRQAEQRAQQEKAEQEERSSSA